MGAPVWDLWELIKVLDPKYIGCQFDIRHATVEGGQAWPLHLKVISPWIKTLAVKDFFWEKQENRWRAVNCPLGKGAVDFVHYFQLLKSLSISGPVSVHYEYDLGGANHGAVMLTMEKEIVLKALNDTDQWIEKITSDVKAYVKETLQPQLGKVITHSGIKKVMGSKTVLAPAGTTTRDWDIIVIPLAPGNRFSELADQEGLPETKPKLGDISGYINQYTCYVSRSSDKEWIIYAGQVIENTLLKRTTEPLHVY